MPKQDLPVGAVPGDGQGISQRTAFIRIAQMFTEIYDWITAREAADAAILPPGLMVTLTFELLPSNANLAGNHTFELPNFPKPFQVTDMFFTSYRRTGGDTDNTLNASLYQGDTELASVTALPIPENGIRLMAVSAPSGTIPAGVSTVLDTSLTVPGGSETLIEGLTLWVRGLWADDTLPEVL